MGRAFERQLDRLQQGFFTDGFSQNIGRTRPPFRALLFHGGPGAEKDDWNCPTGFNQTALELQAVHSLRPVVEQQTGGLFYMAGFKEILGGRVSLGPEAGATEQPLG